VSCLRTPKSNCTVQLDVQDFSKDSQFILYCSDVVCLLRSTTWWSFSKTFHRGDGSDSVAQTLTVANATAMVSSMTADTMEAEAEVAVIVVAKVTQMVADTTAELKVATASKTQVVSPLCSNMYTHPHKTHAHTNTYIHEHAHRAHFNTHKYTEVRWQQKMRIYSHTSSCTLMRIYTNRENERSERMSIYLFTFIYMYIYKWERRKINPRGLPVNSLIPSFKRNEGIYIYTYVTPIRVGVCLCIHTCRNICIKQQWQQSVYRCRIQH